jgi:hypothetical protein
MPRDWNHMPEWVGLVVFAALYFVVMKYLLPKLGVPT